MADVAKSVRISFNLNANFKQALNNINTAFNTIQQSAATVNANLIPIAKSINSIKPPADFDKFVGSLKSLANIKANNITQIQTALNNVAKVRFPDFSAMNPKIIAHANAVNQLGDAYKKLGEGMRQVDMRRISNAIQNGNAVINNQGQIVSRNRTAFAQYAYAIGSASSGLSVLGSRLYGITRGFSAISRELSASLGIFVSVFGAMFAVKGVVKDLVAFDDAMRRTAAVANASASELQLMTDAARQMGETTRYTAQQAAEGLQMLALAGLDASEATKALPTVLNAAAAEGIDLEKAADVLLSTMNAYGMEVKNLGGISDILVATSVNSATSLLQLKESMKQVAPIAASAGIDLAQLSALIGTLADTGIRGGKAGTVLKNAITRLLSPTKMVREALANYNLSAEGLIKNNTDAVTGQLDFIAVLEQMRSKSIETGDAMRIFGLIAGSGMVKLLQSSDEAIRKLYETLQNAEGTSLKVAYEMEAGVGGSLRRLKSMWEELSLSIGDAINADLINFFENLTRVIRENKDTIVSYMSFLMKAIEMFLSFSVAIGELIFNFPKLSIALVGATVAIGTFLTALKIAQVTGMTNALSGLISLNFTGLASQVAIAAAKLNLFNLSIQSFNATALLTGIMAIKDNFIVLVSSLGTTLLLLSSQITIALTNIGLLITSFITAHPYVTLLAAALYTLGYAFNFINPNTEKYTEMAKASDKASKATNELTKQLEYQRDELQLISKGYETADKYKTDTASLEERLKILLESANIPLAKRISLLHQLESGQISTNDTIKALNTELQKSLQINLSEGLKEEISAYENQKKGIQELQKEYEYLRQLRQAEENKTPFSIIPTGFNGEETTKRMKEVRQQINESDAQLKKYANSIQNEFIPKYVAAGKSSEEFRNELENTIITIGNFSRKLPKDEINQYTQEFEKLKKEQNSGIDVQTKYFSKTEEGLKQFIGSMQEANALYDEQTKKIEQNTKLQSALIKARESEGLLSLEQSQKEQTDIIKKGALDRLREAEKTVLEQQQLYDKLDDSVKTSESEVTKEYQIALKNREEAYINYIETVTDGLLDLRKQQQEYQDTIAKADKAILDVKEKTNRDILEAETDLVNKSKDLFLKLVDDKIKIEEDLAKEKQRINQEILKEEQSSNSNIANLQESLNDKLRKIRQQGMSDTAKEYDNYLQANDKLYRGRELVNQASQTGNEELLKSGQQLIEQASSLYENLENRIQATYGLTQSNDALIQTEQAASKIKLQKLEEEKKKAIQNANIEKQKKEQAYKDDLTAYVTAYKEKVKTAYDAAQQIISAQKIEIDNYQIKLDLINQEIERMILLKKIALTDTSTPSSIDDNRIQQLEQYEKKLKTLNDVVNKVKLIPEKSTSEVKAIEQDYDNIIDKITQVEDVTKAFDDSISKTTQQEYTIKVNDSQIITLKGDIATIQKKIDELSKTNMVVAGNIEFNNIEETNKEAQNAIKPIEIKADTTQFNQTIKDLSDVLQINIGNVNTQTTEKNIQGITNVVTGLDAEINQVAENPIDVKTDTTQLDNLQLQLDAMKEKLVQVLAKVQGRTDIEQLKTLIDSLTDKVINIKYKITTEGNPPSEGRANGGYIDGYANGGNVFKRLSSPFISKGSGRKDDVPAMLMKGEFVQKVSAVRKYGRDFMAKLNAGAIPKYITQMFADGGFVSNLGLNLRNNHGIDNMLGLMKSSLYVPIPAFASGGYVSNNSDSYNARIELALGNKTYTVKAQTNVAKELVKEMKKYGRVMA